MNRLDREATEFIRKHSYDGSAHNATRRILELKDNLTDKLKDLLLAEFEKSLETFTHDHLQELANNNG